MHDRSHPKLLEVRGGALCACQLLRAAGPRAPVWPEVVLGPPLDLSLSVGRAGLADGDALEVLFLPEEEDEEVAGGL
jgi:hypothetical protein